jgi:hypothetical protein
MLAEEDSRHMACSLIERLPMSPTIVILSIATSLCASGCVKAQPPTDTGDPVVSSPTSPTTPTPTSPSGPTTGESTALAYNQDLKPLFASDCLVCHGPTRADGNYRMTTYAQVMQDVRAGSAASRLVTITQPSGSMYRYFSGSTATRQAKASEIRTWVVTYNAQETR